MIDLNSDGFPYLDKEKRSAIDLSLTENWLGHSGSFGTDGHFDLCSYEGVEQEKLLACLAIELDLDPACITLGAGIDGLLAELMAGLKGRSIVSAGCTFPKAAYYARSRDINVVYSAMCADMQVDVDSLLELSEDTNVKAVYLCNPNNPTGLSLPDAEFSRLLTECRSLLIIDEANIEYTRSNYWNVVPQENVIFLRTFSKAYGLAGARVAYAIGLPKTLDDAFGRRPRYPISELSAHVAWKALADQTHIASSREATGKETLWLRERLGEVGFYSSQSSTNCFLARVPYDEMRSHEFYSFLDTKGVRVVRGATFRLGDQWFRVAPQNHSVNQKFVDVIREFHGSPVAASAMPLSP